MGAETPTLTSRELPFVSSSLSVQSSTCLGSSRGGRREQRRVGGARERERGGDKNVGCGLLRCGAGTTRGRGWVWQRAQEAVHRSEQGFQWVRGGRGGGRTCWCRAFEVVFVLQVHPARKALFLAVVQEMVLPTLAHCSSAGDRSLEGRTRLLGKARWGGTRPEIDVGNSTGSFGGGGFRGGCVATRWERSGVEGVREVS